MIDPDLTALAEQAGIAPRWRDAFGHDQEVGPDTLRAVLAAIGLPAGDPAEVAESRDRLREQERGSLPPLVTATLGCPITLPVKPGRFRLVLENGTSGEGEAADAGTGRALLQPIS